LISQLIDHSKLRKALKNKELQSAQNTKSLGSKEKVHQGGGERKKKVYLWK
jgi:hypothetical protein